MIERTTAEGRWESPDDGRTWLLVEPDPDWLASRPPEPDPVDPVAELMAQLPAATLEETNDILAEVLALLGGA